MSIMTKISKGLSKTREKMAQAFQAVFERGPSRDYELLEEFLLLADVGPGAAAAIVARVKEKNCPDLLPALKEELMDILNLDSEDKPVKIFVGINGSGKTTSVGKLCHRYVTEGKKVFVIGTDTFRAAADMQLEEWCRRTGAPCLLGKPGSDPGSVLFDGLNSAAARNADYILCDTAGRLHSNKNLMQELEKIIRVSERVRPGDAEVLLTLDAATGQNALQQMETFAQAVKPAGIILTKLDGSAKGGVAIALAAKYQVPIKYIGVGEGSEDLLPFSADIYVNSLLPENE
ncbi:MAG: signal recognition particle-docking protein FtsY [Eubacteriales bacterium]|nr:signal recognition particle-docking protein FtsY [Eubacteriales bacterium]MDD4768534.1 signal recognition particle-docking protein FtsY [Eubacteriales bacterium]